MKEPSPHLLLQPLLFWQTGSLALLTGIVGVHVPVIALTTFALLCFVDSRSWKPARLIMLLVCLSVGWWMGDRAEWQKPETLPAWLLQSLETRKTVRVTGEIISVDGMPDRRLRIRLHNVHPVEPETKKEHNEKEESNFAPLPGDLNWTWENPTISASQNTVRPVPGQRLTVSLKIRPIRGFRNAGISNTEDYWGRHGVFFQSWSKGGRADAILSGEPSRPAALREKLRQTVAVALGLEAGATLKRDGEGRGVIPALLFGDRFYLHTSDMERVKSAGLAHSLALSGQHLTVVGLGALVLVIGIGFAFPGVFLHVPAFNLLALLSMPLAAVYLWLGGAPPSLVRAALMLLVWCLFQSLSGGLLRRCFRAVRLCLADVPQRKGLPETTHSLLAALAFPDALLVALTCMVLFDPLCLYDVGVQLSFTAVAGIALATPLLRRLWLDGALAFSPLSRMRNEIPPTMDLGSRCVRFLWLTLGCSLAAQLATLPVTMEVFGYTTLWFPVNLIWLPVLGFVVLPLAFLGLLGVATGSVGGTGITGLGRGLLELAALPCDWLFRGLKWLELQAGMAPVWGLRPHWTGIVGYGAVLVALALLVGRHRIPSAAKRLFLVGMLLLVVGPLLRLGDGLSSQVTLRILDVGQGQAVLLEWPRDSRGTSGYMPQRLSEQRDTGLRGASDERQEAEQRFRNALDRLPGENQGRSVLSGRARALIDGGGFFSQRFDSGRDIVSPVLTTNRQPQLDFIALSHPDQDHLRGLLFIGKQFEIDAAFTAQLPGIDEPLTPRKPQAEAFVTILAERAIPRHTLQAGDRLVLWSPNARREKAEVSGKGEKAEEEGLVLEVLAPAAESVPIGNNGLIFRLVYRGQGLALLPGDAEAPYLRALLRSGAALQSEVLVLPHHGSAGSMVPALYEAVAPRLAVSSAGAFNSFRLPSWRVRAELERQGIPLHITADEGELVFAWELEENLQGVKMSLLPMAK